MKSRWIKAGFCLTLAAVVALGSAGCGAAAAAAEPTAAQKTVWEGRRDVVASAGKKKLTNEELQIYYRMEIARFQREDPEQSPDFSLPLEDQTLETEGETLTWHQYFVGRALGTWHTRQALEQRSRRYVEQTEPNFQQNRTLHEKYLPPVPIMDILYDNDATFRPNTLHQEFLDGVPEFLDGLAAELGCRDRAGLTRELFGVSPARLIQYVRLLNWDYAYFTDLSYEIRPTAEQVETWIEEHPEAMEGLTRDPAQVDFRHILLIPEDGTVAEDGTVTATQEQWEDCVTQGENLLSKWKRKKDEGNFADLANQYSRDEASRITGGLYISVAPGQMTEALDQWLFDEGRAYGDMDVVRSDCGVHVVWFRECRDRAFAEARKQLVLEQSRELVDRARRKYPLTIHWEKVDLQPVTGSIVLTDADFLYPDVAHERFPEVPVYLQQDYRHAPYGDYTVSSHGCGISALAMLSTYMTDEPLTPAVLAARYGSYNSRVGSDTRMFINTPPEMGYFLEKRTYDWNGIEDALKEGKMVISLQSKGFFTTTGHFLVLTKVRDDGLIVVRDSNIYNYKRLAGHMIDGFEPRNITEACSFYWIYEPKVTRIPNCVRCGDGEHENPRLLHEGYLCHKCRAALERRNNFLDICG